jgi:hypothetical protein
MANHKVELLFNNTPLNIKLIEIRANIDEKIKTL